MNLNKVSNQYKRQLYDHLKNNVQLDELIFNEHIYDRNTLELKDIDDILIDLKVQVENSND